MVGSRLTRVFASRWSALWWAGGIVLLAWQVASSDDLTSTDSATPTGASTATAAPTPPPTPTPTSSARAPEAAWFAPDSGAMPSPAPAAPLPGPAEADAGAPNDVPPVVRDPPPQGADFPENRGSR